MKLTHNRAFPKCFKPETKPHHFCPGCGHAITLKALGSVIDDLGIQDRLLLGIDIGCSLLAWDVFEIDSIQTHHGRTIPTMVGFKRAKSENLALAYVGDGASYAIGAHHLINAAIRDDKITVITTNNSLYAMTGGQMSPTTMVGEITTTSPNGRNPDEFGFPARGPEMVAAIASDTAYVARAIVTNYIQLQKYIRRALENQMAGNGFSFLEILSMCPTNWKTDAAETLEFTEQGLGGFYPVGEFKGWQNEEQN